MAVEVLCAIYTRKSTEEGLEQDFNSLDAQREACAAYIASQKHEGWKALQESYDDGGFSGGNANRPALLRLMADIKAGKVNTIVVYKIDRLTRSLADFAKMVELFDTHGVTFVSVTQQFNTTTSMGRLTLNVLLSFAQFEREVTGERIRDKIAASKAKGMWMGGSVPLGYDAHERHLHVNEQEAKLVRHIYSRYLELGSVNKLLLELNGQGVVTKAFTNRKGTHRAGKAFHSGPLYYLLGNRIYLGEITHKDKVYQGNHEAIIAREVWEQVQALRAENRHEHRHRIKAKEKSLLAGRLFDAEGLPMVPTHSNKVGRRYRYYESRAALRAKVSKATTITKIPAGELEATVAHGLMTLLGDDIRLMEALGQATLRQREAARDLAAGWKGSDQHVFIRQVVVKVVLEQERIICHVSPMALGQVLNGERPDPATSKDSYVLDVPVRLKRVQGGATMIVHGADAGRTANPVLVKAIAKGHVWNRMLVEGKFKNLNELAREVGVDSRYIRKLLPLAWLAPDIVGLVLVGREPSEIRLDGLLQVASLEWDKQRVKLGLR